MLNYLLFSSSYTGVINTSAKTWVNTNLPSDTLCEYDWHYSGKYVYTGKPQTYFRHHWLVRTNRESSNSSISESEDNGSTLGGTVYKNFNFPVVGTTTDSYSLVKLANDTVNSRLMAMIISYKASTNTAQYTMSDHLGATYYSSTLQTGWYYPNISSITYNYNTGLTVSLIKYMNSSNIDVYNIITSNGNIYSLPFINDSIAGPYGSVIGVTYGNGVYVLAYQTKAVSPNYISYTKIYSSTDLQNWTLRYTSPGFQGYAGQILLKMIYNRYTGNFIATGWNGSLITSSDGINWIVRNFNPSGGLSGPKNLQAGYYSTSTDRHVFAVSSQRTLSWNVVAISVAFTYTTELPGGALYTSGDTVNGKMSYGGTRTPCMNSIAYSPTLSRYVTAGQTENIFYSNNAGTSWTLSNNAVSVSNARQYRGVAWGAGKFVAVGGGYNSTNYIIHTSTPTDIISYSSTGLSSSWTHVINNGSTRIFTDIAFSTSINRFVVGVLNYATSTPTPVVLYSADGVSWSSTTLPSINGYTDRVFFTKISYIADKNVFIGLTNKPGLVGFSTDGLSWTFTNVNSNYTFYSIIYGNNVLILGSDNAFIIIQIPSTVTASTLNTHTVYTSSTNLGQIQGGSWSTLDGWIVSGLNVVLKSANSTTWVEYVGSAFYDLNGVSNTLYKSDYSTFDGTTAIQTSVGDTTYIYTTDGITLESATLPDYVGNGWRYVNYPMGPELTYGNYHFLYYNIRSPF